MKSMASMGPGRAWLSVCIWPESPVTEGGRVVPAEAVLFGAVSGAQVKVGVPL